MVKASDLAEINGLMAKLSKLNKTIDGGKADLSSLELAVPEKAKVVRRINELGVNHNE